MSEPKTSEFLVQMTLDENAVPETEAGRLFAEERSVALAMKASGTLQRMWRIPGRTATFSVWRVRDATQLHEELSRMPLRRWMRVEVTALARHYLDEQESA